MNSVHPEIRTIGATMLMDLKQHALALAAAEWGGQVDDGRLMPIAATLAPLVRDDDAVSTVDGSWFAIATEPKEERHVSHGLMSVGVLPYVPLEPKEERAGRGATRVVLRPFIPGYVFGKCYLTDRTWHAIMTTRGVRRMLSDANGKPQYIRDREIEIIRASEGWYHQEEEKRQQMLEARRIAQAGGRSGIVWHFTAGDVVRIKNGPFAEFYAELTTAVDVHDRIRAIVNVFGRASVIDLSAHDVVAP